MSDIQIRILNDEQFDNLPIHDTLGADVSQSIGFANVPSRKVFVRDTGFQDLNEYLINHELEHLFELEGTHEDSEVAGIRHKKFRDTVRAFFNPLNVNFGPGTSNERRGFANIGKSSKAKKIDKEADANRAAQAQAAGLRGIFQGAAARPLDAFGQGSAVTPTQPASGGGGQGPAGTLSTGLGGAGLGTGSSIAPGLKERVKGFFSGRIPF